MQRGPEPEARPVAIVLGCDEIGSAVAHRLHRDGFAVVLIDGVDPPWPRRGMAFTDAWYAGDRTTAPPLLTIEVVPGAITGPEFDVAIRVPAPQPVRERVLYAPCAGRFSTSRSIGEHVRVGENVGSVGEVPIMAPIDGCLRGLSARGARVRVGSELVEIDPRADPTRCFGLDERSNAIARAVSEALEDEGSPRRAAARKRGITAAS